LTGFALEEAAVARPDPPARRWPFIVVANSLPVRRTTGRGRQRWATSPGGLVSALVPVVRAARGAWVGWTGTAGAAPRPFEHDGITNVPIPLTAAEVQDSYEGLCNRTLWPLYHDAVRQPEYHRDWWRAYVSVNRRVAERTAAIAARGARVWVQDYHLQLVPSLLRSVRPDLRIGFFLHIPFPPEELFVRLPWRAQLLDGLLGADVIGFQTDAGARNFRRLAVRFTAARGSDRGLEIVDRRIRVAAFPISIDFGLFDQTARRPAVVRRVAQIRASLGPGRRVLLGVDRLDYTKGIDLRLSAFREFLTARPELARTVVLIQVAVPSRTRIAEYRDLRRQVEGLVGRVNGQFGDIGVQPVHYLRRNLPHDELVATYAAADVMVVTPLADGMNLVAKEYAATRSDERGVLMLSEFAGASAELRSALPVNPHDVDGMAETMARALALPPAEQRQRMRILRRAVRSHTVQDWAREFLRAIDRAAPRRALARSSRRP
jgi:trehalose 6-phosphate synthase